MGIVTLDGHLICSDETQAQIVRDYIDEHIRLSRAEPGCLHFEVRATKDPLIWQVSESFINETAFQTHQVRTRNSIWAEKTRHIRRNFVKLED
ncbi:MAG: putative quinol monooxygenase [Pseudorhodobacter sp.]